MLCLTVGSCDQSRRQKTPWRLREDLLVNLRQSQCISLETGRDISALQQKAYCTLEQSLEDVAVHQFG